MRISLVVFHLLWNALKRMLPRSSHRDRSMPVVLEGSNEGLRIWACHAGMALSYDSAEATRNQKLTLTAQVLEELGSRNRGTVELEPADGMILARWEERGIPRVKELAAGDATLAALPEMPSSFGPGVPHLIQALEQAMQMVAKDGSRFAIQNIQLRGSTGEIVGTDGRHLLVQGGFNFPWKEDVLIARSNLPGWKELSQAREVSIGRTEKHVCLKADGWTFWLPIDTEGRYPRIDHILPDEATASTRLDLDPDDARFLAQSLPGLPGDAEEFAPLTVEVNGKVAVRAKESGGRATELILTRSRSQGHTVQFVTNRRYLGQALELGFTQARIFGPDRPVLCQDGRRRYLWMTLNKDSAIPSSPGDLRIWSQANSDPSRSERRSETVNRPSPSVSTEPVHEQATPPSDFSSLQEEVRSLQNVLRDALARANNVANAMKQYRRRARAIQTSLATLRQLQTVEV